MADCLESTPQVVTLPMELGIFNRLVPLSVQAASHRVIQVLQLSWGVLEALSVGRSMGREVIPLTQRVLPTKVPVVLMR